MLLPKISIITPSYNQDDFIEETILSVIGQNYPNLEYIIIDGGSTDSSAEIIESYEQKLTYWVSEKDKGQSHAINKGFRKATGDILLWLNSDDLLMPGALFKIGKQANTDKAEIIFGNCIHFKNENGLFSIGSDVVSKHKKYALENFDYIIQPSSCWTMKTWKAVGELNESMHYGFDWEWFLRARQMGITFTPIEDCLSLYRIHASHKTGTGGSARNQELAAIYKKFAPQNETLFNRLLEDKDFNKSRLFGLVKKVARRIAPSVTDEDILRNMKPSRYKGFSKDAMWQVREMT